MKGIIISDATPVIAFSRIGKLKLLQEIAAFVNNLVFRYTDCYNTYYMMNFKFLKLGLIAVFGTFVVVSTVHAATKIKDTRHNLSSSSLYTVKAVSENQICIFCHAPHNADSSQAPLWSHAESTATTFQMASTANVSPNRAGSWADPTPTGISKKCLSCHDGTVAIGALANGNTIPVTNASGGAGDILAGGDYGFIGTDLRGGHVISFKYESFQETIDAGGANFTIWDSQMSTADKKSMFDRDGKMQCHTCHDPHNDWCNDPVKNVGRDPLWRKACDVTYGNASVCRVCHKNMVTFQKYSF